MSAYYGADADPEALEQMEDDARREREVCWCGWSDCSGNCDENDDPKDRINPAELR